MPSASRAASAPFPPSLSRGVITIFAVTSACVRPGRAPPPPQQHQRSRLCRSTGPITCQPAPRCHRAPASNETEALASCFDSAAGEDAKETRDGGDEPGGTRAAAVCIPISCSRGQQCARRCSSQEQDAARGARAAAVPRPSRAAVRQDTPAHWHTACQHRKGACLPLAGTHLFVCV